MENGEETSCILGNGILSSHCWVPHPNRCVAGTPTQTEPLERRQTELNKRRRSGATERRNETRDDYLGHEKLQKSRNWIASAIREKSRSTEPNNQRLWLEEEGDRCRSSGLGW
ncbi:hypothetical protein HN873_007821, partial [Arachis hypogaea]